MVLMHGHLQVLVYEAENVGRAYYSKKSIFKSFFKGCAQNAKQAVEKTKHADRDCYVAVYAGTRAAFRCILKSLSSASCEAVMSCMLDALQSLITHVHNLPDCYKCQSCICQVQIQTHVIQR